MVFLLTSAAGSALWSVHVEQQSAQATEEEGMLPEYSDDA